MNWISFEKQLPPEDLKLFLGTQDWCGHQQIAICENEIRHRNDGKPCYPVYNSICPPIGAEPKAYWMELPAFDKWNKFENEKFNDDDKEIIFKLFNGSIYVGYIDHAFASPSFNMSKYVERRAVELWMDIPELPKD